MTGSAVGNGTARQLRVALLVLVAGLVATALAAWIVHATGSQRDREVFEKHATAAEDAVLGRVDTCIALLRGAAAFVAANGDALTAEEFHAYVDRLGLPAHYAGLLGIGFSRRLAPAEVPALERSMRAKGRADFHVWPEAPRDEYHAILFLEPLDVRNRAAIGYDMSTNPVRRAAMEDARDRGMAAASGRVTLVQEIDNDKQPGFLIYVPVYEGGAIPATVEARRRRLIGFVYAPVRALDFLSHAFAHEAQPVVTMSVYDGAPATPDELMFRRVAPGSDPASSRYSLVRTMELAGRPWTLELQSQATRVQSMRATIAVALVGGLVSVLVAVLTWREARARAASLTLLERERHARADAEHASVLKDEFLATLSHELRTPLNAIVGWAHVLAQPHAAAAQVQRGIEAIARNARAQVRLVDDLLDVGRAISGKLRLNLTRVDVAEVIASCIESVLPAAEARGVRLEKSVGAGVEGLQADPERLQQILWNLVSNGIKFTPQGGVVRITAARTGDAVRLTVSDTGEGISADFLPYAFDRFRQADAGRTRQHGGLGLGLAIVRHLVELHGGRVSAASDGPGRGSTFVVDLPFDRPEPKAARRLRAAPAAVPVIGHEPAPAGGDLAGLDVLYVDDEQDARALVRHILEERGATVRTAGSGHEALAMMHAAPPAMLVSDIGMPGMDGYELLRRVRALPSLAGGRIPAVAFSAYARAEDRANAHRAGYQAYLTKPLDPVALVRTLASLRRAALEPPRANAI